MVLIECRVEVENNNLLPSTKFDVEVTCGDHWRGNVFNEIINWRKVDEQTDIMFGFVSCSPLSFQERGTDRLHYYVVLLWYLQDALSGEFVTYFLHDSF